MRHLIVGIDTGNTSAIACIDLNGLVVKTATARHVGLGWFVDAIKMAGSPVIIAGDKKKPDRIVSRLSAIFGAVLFIPSTNISIAKKRIIAKEGFENLHERDAIAAARLAFNAYADKLRQTERLARCKNAEAEEIKALVIKKQSVHEAIYNIKANRMLSKKVHS